MASKVKKQEPSKGGPKGPRKYNWEDLRRKFLAGKWLTLDQMAKETGISTSTLYKQAGARGTEGSWLDVRKELERQAAGRTDEILIEDRASLLAEMHRRHLDVAKQLFLKSANQLLGKKLNKQGRLVEKEFDSESAALQGLRLAMAAEQSLLMRKVDPDAPGGATFNGPTLFLGAGGTAGAQRAMRELSTVDLQKIIDAKEVDGPGRAKKTGGKGDAG